jgi:serine O-acetyltransferase
VRNEAHAEHRRINRLLNVGNWMVRRKHLRIAYVVDLIVRIVFSADIPCRLSVPVGVVFMHNGLGTVIDANVVFEGPALVFQGSTLGHTIGGREGCPVIGSRVVIGAGAAVLGGIRIGAGSLVTAGSVVSRDVPDNSKASGNPAVVTALDTRRFERVWVTLE